MASIGESDGRARDEAPRSVRLAILSLLAAVTAGGLYLLAVRGPAVLIDLYAATKLFLCL